VPDPEALRGRLEHALRFDIEHEGSLYLNALACVYLAAPEASEPALVGAFNLQAEAEHVDADQVLQDLLAVLT
jgi:hypothetical protein